MTFSLDIDLRQVGQGIYNYVVAGLQQAIPAWTDMAADMMLDNWRAAATGRMYPGMTRSLNSDVYRLALERSGVTMNGNAGEASVFAPEEVQMGSGNPFNLHRRIEFGAPPFSIRDAWLRNGARGARHGKRGAYIIIPFRHGSGESVHFKSNLDPHVRALAQGGSVNERRYKRMTENPWSSAITRYKGPHGPAVQLGLGPKYRKTVKMSTPATKYTWKRAMLAGVKRYGRAGHTSYLTFRTMSEASDPSAWVVPALPANPVAQSVLAYVQDQVRARIRADMEQMAPGGNRP
jgi:hypothetical protein